MSFTFSLLRMQGNEGRERRGEEGRTEREGRSIEKEREAGGIERKSRVEDAANRCNSARAHLMHDELSYPE